MKKIPILFSAILLCSLINLNGQQIDLSKNIDNDKRMIGFETNSDPNLASLCYHFGRYLLISSSLPGTEPANLQGIWNENMNPSWDSKYTTNINTEMNYWPVESANLSDCAEPLIRMVRELTDQGSQVAKEHYGARGWVFHQNTDMQILTDLFGYYTEASGILGVDQEFAGKWHSGHAFMMATGQTRYLGDTSGSKPTRNSLPSAIHRFSWMDHWV